MQNKARTRTPVTVSRDLRVHRDGRLGVGEARWFLVEVDELVEPARSARVERFGDSLLEAAGVAELLRYGGEWFALRTTRPRMLRSVTALVLRSWAATADEPDETSGGPVNEARARK